MDTAHLMAGVGILLMLLGVTSRAGLSAATEPVHDVPELEGITVDGHPEDWAENGLCASLLAPVNGWSQAAPLRPPDDHDVRIRLGWNEDGLLVLVRVRDDEWVEHPDESWLFTHDAVEMFLGTRPGSTDFVQWVIAPGMTPDQAEARWHAYDHRSDPALADRPLAISAARTRSGQECVLEALLPWHQLGIEPAMGREVGFQMWVNDLDSANRGVLTYHVPWHRLKAGTNELFIKLAVSDSYSVTEVSRPTFVRVTDDEGVVPAGITCSVPAPPATNEQRSDFLTERVAAMEDARVDRDADAVVLEGIEPLDWGTGEMCEFASALTRTLGCVGESVPYHYLMGVTGVAFRFTMGPELWNPGFYGFEGASPDLQDLFRRAFAAVGYEYHWYPRGDRADDLRRIAESIDRGIPVMLRGHVIDASDWPLITGYARDGDTLYGSSPYGGTDKFKGYDVVEDWHARTKEYIILGDKCDRPAAATIYADALRLAVQLVRSADRHRGLNAYDVLAAALRDEEFPEDAEGKEDQPGFRYLCLLCYNMMLDDHASAAPFLRDAAEALPEARTELLHAADCYEQSRVLRDRLEGILPSDFSAEAQSRVLDPGIREEFARVIEQIRESDEQAIAHIERALAARGDGNP